ncbi:MAG: YkgJ family cysteine cluster protein [Lentisphaeria bacterium]|nr:YkgJ family cysteine cluster protein [Lentisphaeria bacterium]
MASRPKVHISRRQRYACILCGRCCRRFHVLLTPVEAERLAALDWGDAEGVPRDFTTRLHGHLYFRRAPTGGCVFLDESTGACRIHQRFGLAVKALTCRGYPHNIASTWPGEVSVVARMDCPAVQRNAGPPLETNRAAIERMVTELGTSGGFTGRQLEGLSRDAVETVIRALTGLLEDAADLPPGTRAYGFFLAAERFRALGSSFLNDLSTLRQVIPSLLERVKRDASRRRDHGIGWFSRAVCREWLAAYCRRDEELAHPSLRDRVVRTASLAGYAFGLGSLRVMGSEHPAISLRAARLFTRGRGWTPSDHAAWECYWRLLLARLEGPQFFGVAYYDTPLFTGLRALAQSYALVLAAARCHAAERNADRIETEDVHYAVGAIDHCLGRSPLLQFRLWRLVEDHFSGVRYARLLTSLGWE